MASLGRSGRHLTFPFQYVIMRNRMAMMSRACNPYNHLERWEKSALTGQERGCLPPVLEQFSSLVRSLVVWQAVSGPGIVATGARKSLCMPKKTIQSRTWCYFKLPLVGLRYPDMPCYLGPGPRSCNGKLGHPRPPTLVLPHVRRRSRQSIQMSHVDFSRGPGHNVECFVHLIRGGHVPAPGMKLPSRRLYPTQAAHD